MKPILLFLLTISLKTSGQSVNNVNRSILVEAYDVNGTNMTALKKTDIEGSPYTNDNWRPGKVVLVNGRVIHKLPIRFDLHKQVLQFRQDSMHFTFSDPVKEFMLPVADSTNQQVMVFRSGYPVNNTLTSRFFYNVLYSGVKYDLVKAVFCRLQDNYQYIGSSSQQYLTSEELYVFDIQKQRFTKVKKGGQQKLEPLNSNNTAAKQYFDTHSMYSEADLVEWIMLLNK